MLMVMFCVNVLYAQSTRVRGRVVDGKTGLPLAYVNVSLMGTTSGAVTDVDGVYSFESRDTVSRLEVTSIGYQSQTRWITPKGFNEVNVKLQPVVFNADEVVVKAGVNPAVIVLREVVKHRNQNDPDRYNQFTCQTYTKMQLDLNNMKDSFKSERLQRNFGFIFDYMDTSALTGKAVLPVMISETVADYYHSRNPKIEREVIRANRISGVKDNSSLAQFTGRMYVNVNFYDNFIDLFEVQFAGPVAQCDADYYDYRIADSLWIDNRLTLKITYRPKRTAVPVFEGELYIDDETYAIRSASAKMAKGINVNWVTNLLLECENQLLDSIGWFRRRDNAVVEFAIEELDEMVSVLGSRQIVYSDVSIDRPIPESVVKQDSRVNLLRQNVSVSDEQFWSEARPYKLSEREENIYKMVDQIKDVPLYKNIYTIINTIFSGYYKTKYVGFGPYFKLLSYNDLEGWRTQLGLRTTTDFSRRIRLNGYAAYGLGDEKFKGGGSVELRLGDSELTRKLTLGGLHDIRQLGSGENALTEGNILATLMSRGSQRLSMVERFDLGYEHEWRAGVTNMLSANVQKIYGNEFVPMQSGSGHSIEFIEDRSMALGFRLSFRENVVRSTFDNFRFGSPYPIFSASARLGSYSVAQTDKSYFRVDLGVDYDLQLPPIGVSELVLRGGKIFGQVPYPLLKLHEANGTYIYDPFAFSCMNYYEFASDRWLTLFWEHHFNGWLFGRLPLLKDTRWREVLICKSAWGALSDRNLGNTESALVRSPEGMGSLNKPYVELGVGVENIWRLIRVDFIWRVTHRDHQSVDKIERFATNISLQLKF